MRPPAGSGKVAGQRIVKYLVRFALQSALDPFEDESWHSGRCLSSGPPLPMPGPTAGRHARRRGPTKRIRGPMPEGTKAHAAFLPLRLEASSSSRMIRTAMRIWAGVCSEVMKNRNRAAFRGTAG